MTPAAATEAGGARPRNLWCPCSSGVRPGQSRGAQLSCPTTITSSQSPAHHQLSHLQQRQPGPQAPGQPRKCTGRREWGLLGSTSSKAVSDPRRGKAFPEAAWAGGRCELGTPRLPEVLLTSPSPSLSLSLCPAAGLSGFPSGVTLTLWSGKVEDPFLRATQEVC